MISEKEITKISKLLCLVLRHQPDVLKIELDEQGWTDVPILIEKLKNQFPNFDDKVLDFVVENNNKKRFAFNDNKSKIRASQGHTIKVELGYTAQIPPDILYHGTAEHFLDSILKTGIQKQQRHHLHLSKSLETALNVGQRHGKVVVLEVNAAKMQEDGYQFFVSENQVWLTDFVPIKYFNILNQ